MTETMTQLSNWEHCGNTEPHVTHTYDVSEQGVPTHCLGSPWTNMPDQYDLDGDERNRGNIRLM